LTEIPITKKAKPAGWAFFRLLANTQEMWLLNFYNSLIINSLTIEKYQKKPTQKLRGLAFG
jgi:hypothetical protein